MAETRFVTVQADITVTVEADPKPIKQAFTFWDFMKVRTKDAAFGKDLDGVLMAMAIRQHFAGCDAGDVVGIELAQWDALCASVRTPSDGYNPEVMAQLLPFARAILDAPTTDPRLKAEPEGEPDPRS